MIKNYVDLKRNEKFEKKIRIACDFHCAKYKFTRGRILNVDKVNVSFIEPHRFLIELKKKIDEIFPEVIRIYDNDNISKKCVRKKRKTVRYLKYLIIYGYLI